MIVGIRECPQATISGSDVREVLAKIDEARVSIWKSYRHLAAREVALMNDAYDALSALAERPASSVEVLAVEALKDARGWIELAEDMCRDNSKALALNAAAIAALEGSGRNLADAPKKETSP